MTDKEWQELARETKNNLTYSKLIKEIWNFCLNTKRNRIHTPQEFIKFFSKSGVRAWHVSSTYRA